MRLQNKGGGGARNAGSQRKKQMGLIFANKRNTLNQKGIKNMDANLSRELNGQLNFEIYSAYIYLSMSSFFKSLSLNGFANWMEVQAQEEFAHVRRLYNYLHERGEKVEYDAVPKPVSEWDSPLAAFEEAYAHEQVVTSRINNLVNLAIEAKDHATNAHLQWFVSEQVEEEANSLEVVRQIKLVKDAPNGLFLLDRELGQRVFVDPNATGNA